MDEDRKKKACMEVLKSSCHKIFLELRFLELAIFRLVPEERKPVFFGTDGEKLYYDRDYLLNRYLEKPEAAACDYLHTVIHCLYQHPFQAGKHQERYWNLAADIAVADVVGEMGVPWISRQLPGECLKIADHIKGAVPLMSAPHIAGYLEGVFAQKEELGGYGPAELEAMFRRDSHACWGAGSGEDQESSRQEDGEGAEPGTEQENTGSGADGAEREDGGGREHMAESGSPVKAAARMERLSREWKETAESVALHAKSVAKDRGNIPGSMLLAIQRLTREKCDYTEFLKKFAVHHERMKINQDEFDYTYYLYGLGMLKKIPLIEPLEYKEEKQIREFVVALDTSGSCSESLVQRFLNKTYNLLCQNECFSDQSVLHIIQCDAAVQGDVRIASLEHLEAYISGMTLRGGGGTDFRPVFAYVDQLCAQGELKRLGGLIYFTDGYGVFPVQPPAYKTAFVFVEREDDVRVPPWAIRIYLEDV
jgi:predicted metal-dependent peptidase